VSKKKNFFIQSIIYFY